MSYFRNMRLAAKVGVLSFCFFIFLGIIGYTSLKQISVVNSKLMELNDSRLMPIVKLESIKSDIEYIRAQANSLLDAGNDDSLKEPVQVDIQGRAALAMEKLLEEPDTADNTELVESLEVFIEAMERFIDNNGVGVVNLRFTPGSHEEGSGEDAGIPNDISSFDDARGLAVESFDSYIDEHIVAAKKTYDEGESIYRKTMILLISLVLTSLLVSILLSIVITKSITIPVNRVTTKLKEISNSGGDLTQRIDYCSKDEFGELSKSFDKFIERLQSIIKEVAISADTIATSSEELTEASTVSTQALEEISNAVIEIAAGSAAGANVTKETSNSIKDFSSFSEATSIATRKTSSNSKRVEASAQEGSERITEVVASISDIAVSSRVVAKMIKELDDSSRKIGDIISIITAVSEQTNLLALNAAIEAARAGEAGKGFNVVAEEIRKLADETKSAARGISELVTENQLITNTAVGSVNLVEDKVAIGVNKAAEVEKSIKSIIEDMKGIVLQIEEIDKANLKQANSTKTFEGAIDSLTNTTMEIAEGTESISASLQEQLSTMMEVENTTQQLSHMALKLNSITTSFKV